MSPDPTRPVPSCPARAHVVPHTLRRQVQQRDQQAQAPDRLDRLHCCHAPVGRAMNRRTPKIERPILEPPSPVPVPVPTAFLCRNIVCAPLQMLENDVAQIGLGVQELALVRRDKVEDALQVGRHVQLEDAVQEPQSKRSAFAKHRVDRQRDVSASLGHTTTPRKNGRTAGVR